MSLINIQRGLFPLGYAKQKAQWDAAGVSIGSIAPRQRAKLCETEGPMGRGGGERRIHSAETAREAVRNRRPNGTRRGEHRIHSAEAAREAINPLYVTGNVRKLVFDGLNLD